jgi:hypothetical protein
MDLLEKLMSGIGAPQALRPIVNACSPEGFAI